MKEEDKQFLQDISYFWKFKGDAERFTGFDLERFQKLDPVFAQQWIDYKVTISMLNSKADKYLW